MAPRGKKRPRESCAQAIIDEATCPITMQLIVNPVVAEDGNLYERSALMRWLADGNTKSPSTGAPMDPGVVESNAARNLVRAAIDSGGVDEKDAAAWHVASARCHASGELPGGMSAAKEHLDRAERCAPSAESSMLLKALDIRAQVDKLVQEADAAGIVGLGDFVKGHSTPNGGIGATMKKWRDDLRSGVDVVRIINDARELERLCRRPAPGSDKAVDYCAGMEELCGRCFVIGQTDKEDRSIEICPSHFFVPYDACIHLTPALGA